MSVDAIRAKLVTELGAITGVTKVYKDLANVAPTAADCPCFILEYGEPACRARSETNSSIEYTWFFNLTFLYKPEGLGNPDENMSGLEDFIKLFVDKMAANITGGGTWRYWNKDTGTLDFTAGVIGLTPAPEGTRYFAWTCNLEITESVTTTMSTG